MFVEQLVLKHLSYLITQSQISPPAPHNRQYYILTGKGHKS